MNTFIEILYKTRKTFDVLDEQYEDDLDIRITIIFTIYGMVLATESFFKERLGDFGLIGAMLSFTVITGLGLIIGKFVFSYSLYWIGRLLKGNSKIIDIQTVVAYSLLPRILELPVILYLGSTDKLGKIHGVEFYLFTVIYLIISMLTIKILIQGLARYNGYGFWKAIVNICPFILIGLFFYLFVLLR